MRQLTALPKYKAYKDSGVEWLGEIPGDWGVKKGKWLFLKVDRKITKNNEIITCFRDGIVTLRKNRRTEGFTNALKEHGYQGVRKGDLVIHAMDAFAGAIGVSDSDGKSSPVYSVCTPQHRLEVNTNYYSFYLRHLALMGFIESLAKGIRERSTDFRFKDFAELFLPFPPLTEQTTIANFLDKKTAQINKAIAIKEQQIQLLKEYQQTIIQKSVTQGLDPNVPMKDSGVEWIGKIPQHWRVKKGKWLFLKVDRKITKNNEIITCFRDGIVTLRKNRRTEGFTNALKEHGYQGVRKGDLVIHAMDAFAGAIGVSDSDGKSSPVYSVCVPQNKLEVDTNYYSFYLRHLALIGFIESLAKGIRERSTDFRFKDFTELFLPIPPKKEQLMIVAFLQKNAKKINNTIKIQQKQIQKLKEYKATLINSAVTGKIKVS